MSQPLIELRKLCKRFGSESSGGILAVDGLTFSVSAGEVLGFLGPNGAGKSTTMKMVTGFLPPTSGQAVVCGHDVVESPLKVKERVGYLPEGAPLYSDMTPEAFLGFVADCRRLKGDARKRAIERAVGRTNLGGVMRQPIDTLSKGFKRRVGLAQAIMHEPDVLILDEPTDGLDPNQKHEVRGLIREMASQANKAIVLSTHILEEVEAVCTRVVVIAQGRIVADTTPLEMLAKSRYHNAVSLALSPPPGTMVFDELRRLPGVRDVEDGGSVRSGGGSAGGVGGAVQVRCTVIPSTGRSVAAEISNLVKARGWQVDHMRVESGRLDDVFRVLTGGREGEGTKDRTHDRATEGVQ